MADAVSERPWTVAARVRPVPEDPFLELPSWPVLCLMWGLPLWWLAGLFPFASTILAPVMLFYLAMRRHVWLAPGTLSFLALVLWMSLGVLVIAPGDLLGFGVKFVQYAAAGVLIVYVVNAPFRLTRRRLLDGLTAMWAFMVAGGYLGLLHPYGRLSETVGRLLPHNIRAGSYAQDLFFPQFAEIQTPYGAHQAFIRPSAPFNYANGWGAAMTLLIPVVVAAAIDRNTTRSWLLTVLGLGLCIPPAVAANNRGMFLALGVAVVVVLLRWMAHGRLEAVFGLAVLSLGAALVMIRLGVVQSITDRADAGKSAEGRSLLYQETYERTLKSPIVGYGAPRPSFSTEITVGTQGAVWALMFCCGFVGLGLFAWFVLGAICRTWSLTSAADVWLNAALIAAAVMCVYYGIDRMLVPLGAVIAMMLRDSFLHRMRATASG